MASSSSSSSLSLSVSKRSNISSSSSFSPITTTTTTRRRMSSTTDTNHHHHDNRRRSCSSRCCSIRCRSCHYGNSFVTILMITMITMITTTEWMMTIMMMGKINNPYFLLSLPVLSLPLCHAFMIPSSLSPPHRLLLVQQQQAQAQQQAQKVLFPTKSTSRSTSTISRSRSSSTTKLVLSSSSTSSSSSSSSSNDTNLLPYNWKNQWYALTYASYVPYPSKSAETVPAAVFGYPLVLWRSDDSYENIHCADDVCPHRQAALSEGRIRDGKLECYYHGWQFHGGGNGNGKTSNNNNDNDQNSPASTSPSTAPAPAPGSCTFIPQLPKGGKIPKRACLRMRPCRVVEGIVWVWMGDEDYNNNNDESSSLLPDVPMQGDGLDPITGKRKGFILNDFQIDLPYDHSYLVENLIDPAHIPISHDRTPGGGRREQAQAYDMIVDTDSISSTGFTGRYRVESMIATNGPYIQVQYQAPGIIRQQGRPRGNDSPIQFGAALHCMPLSLGRSRLLFRAYFGGVPPPLSWMIKFKPGFLRHLNSCKILEQDAGLITTQEDYYKRNMGKKNLQDDFLLLQSSDLFIKTYRQWLDQVGHGMPWFQGLATQSTTKTSSSTNNILTNKSNNNNIAPNDHLQAFVAPTPALDPLYHRAGNFLETRYHRHVLFCPETRNALKRIQWLKKCMMSLAILAVTISCSTNAISTTTTAIHNNNKLLTRLIRVIIPMTIPISSILAALLHQLESRFFVSFKRKEQMQQEKGI